MISKFCSLLYNENKHEDGNAESTKKRTRFDVNEYLSMKKTKSSSSAFKKINSVTQQATPSTCYLTNLVNNPLNHDLILQTEDKKNLYAHKAIIAACSDFFATCLSIQMKESREHAITLQFQEQHLLPVLHFMYSGLTSWPLLQVEEIPDIAEVCVCLQVRSSVSSLSIEFQQKFTSWFNLPEEQRNCALQSLFDYQQRHGETETLLTPQIIRELESILNDQINFLLCTKYSFLNLITSDSRSILDSRTKSKPWEFSPPQLIPKPKRITLGQHLVNQLLCKQSPLYLLCLNITNATEFEQQIAKHLHEFIQTSTFSCSLLNYCKQQPNSNDYIAISVTFKLKHFLKELNKDALNALTGDNPFMDQLVKEYTQECHQFLQETAPEFLPKQSWWNSPFLSSLPNWLDMHGTNTTSNNEPSNHLSRRPWSSELRPHMRHPMQAPNPRGEDFHNYLSIVLNEDNVEPTTQRRTEEADSEPEGLPDNLFVNNIDLEAPEWTSFQQQPDRSPFSLPSSPLPPYSRPGSMSFSSQTPKYSKLGIPRSSSLPQEQSQISNNNNNNNNHNDTQTDPAAVTENQSSVADFPSDEWAAFSSLQKIVHNCMQGEDSDTAREYYDIPVDNNRTSETLNDAENAFLVLQNL